MQEQLDFVQLLQDQYSIAEEYANIQSRLLNVSMKSSASLASSDDEEIERVLDDVNKYRNRTRSNLARLQHEGFHKLYPAHVALSLRVINTIANNPSWNANGIPSHFTNILETNTVALATLKASIDRITQAEKFHKEADIMG